MRTRVKFCGITRIEDALAAARFGVDAIGLVFYERSPRFVETERARQIAQCLPPFITVVGLFANARREQVDAVLERVRIDLLQFHGDESHEECAGYGRAFIKAVRVRGREDIERAVQAQPDAGAILLDTYRADRLGGTGETFDWSQVPSGLGKPVILAGGLNAANLAAAIACVHPYAVDVSGGIESAKGIKDHAKMRQFVSMVRLIDADQKEHVDGE